MQIPKKKKKLIWPERHRFERAQEGSVFTHDKKCPMTLKNKSVLVGLRVENA